MACVSFLQLIPNIFCFDKYVAIYAETRIGLLVKRALQLWDLN